MWEWQAEQFVKSSEVKLKIQKNFDIDNLVLSNKKLFSDKILRQKKKDA